MRHVGRGATGALHALQMQQYSGIVDNRNGDLPVALFCLGLAGRHHFLRIRRRQTGLGTHVVSLCKPRWDGKIRKMLSEFRA
jgi:hypothetical protein